MRAAENLASLKTADESREPIRVFFDSQIFLLQRYGGISNYFNNLIDAFLENPDLGVIPIVHSTRPLNAAAAVRINRSALRTKAKFAIYARFYIIGLLSRVPAKAEIVHRTYYSRVFRWSTRPNVTTLFDMIPEATGGKWPNPHLSKKYVLSRSAAVASISQSALDYCESIWKWRPRISRVTHLAANIPEVNSATDSPVSKPFLLFVGQRSQYKRGDWALRAARELPQDWSVVFAGPELSKREQKLASSLGVGYRIVCLQPNDEELVLLYREAVALLHTSEIEGFGLPILEAMRQGTPVILGHNDINREVAGDLGIYFDNASLTDFLLKIRKYVESPLKHSAPGLEHKLRSHSETFTWRECARLTAGVYYAALDESAKSHSRIKNA